MTQITIRFTLPSSVKFNVLMQEVIALAAKFGGTVRIITDKKEDASHAVDA